MKWKLFLATVLSVTSLAAFAGECELTINRSACPNKDKEAYDPYKGVNPTVEKKSAANDMACLANAKKACKIVRKDILSKKTVSAKFDGKTVGSANNCEGNKDAVSDCK